MKNIPNILMFLMVIALCAVPCVAQECSTVIVASAPDSRFVVNGNGTVYDTATNLTWKRCNEGQTWNGTDCGVQDYNSYSWKQALELAEVSTFAGHSDWRLPNSKELSSLVEQRCTHPAINATVFPASPSSCVWSGSPSSGDYTDSASVVHFMVGAVYYGVKSNGCCVFLVRGGQ